MWRPDLEDLTEPTRWAPLTLRQYVVIAIIAIGLLSVIELARGQDTRIDCRELAMLIGSVTWAREMGAKRELVLEDLRRRHAGQGRALAAAIVREARMAWHEGLPIDDSIQRAYDRCIARMGELGAEG